MKIVIDIDEKTFEELTKYDEPIPSGNHLYDSALSSIYNGTPLPKGHGRADKEEQESVFAKIRAELIQSIQNGILKIESGNEELFSIIDKYRAESEGVIANESKSYLL